VATGCAQRSAQYYLPINSPGIDGGSGIVINLDAHFFQGEAGTIAVSDARLTCVGSDSGFDLLNDPLNCGACGNLCSFPRSTAACVQGQCVIASCNPGYVDLDKKSDNGCECLQTNGGKEICDGADNDCDGVIDNGFDLQNDANN